MQCKGLLWAIVCAAPLFAQDGQHSSRPGWPCVAGRAVDPSYIEVSESTGGQLFLLQRNEVAQGMTVINASHTHPSTVLRALGTLTGEREFEFNVDSGMQSILVMASLQCRNSVRVLRPNGSELTQVNSIQYFDLQAGRIQQIDLPEPGVWKVKLAGSGLYVVSVLTKSDVRLPSVTINGGKMQARVTGQVSNVKFQIVDAAAAPVADLDASGEDGAWQGAVESPVQRFRIRVTGTDPNGWPFQRTHPVLFRAAKP